MRYPTRTCGRRRTDTPTPRLVVGRRARAASEQPESSPATANAIVRSTYRDDHFWLALLTRRAA